MLADIGLHCGLVFRAEDHFQSFNYVMSYMCKFNDRPKEIKPERFLVIQTDFISQTF